MNNDFLKWLCEKAGYIDMLNIFPEGYEANKLPILIKALWKINREGKWYILMSHMHIGISTSRIHKYFEYKDHDNNEQEALTKALEYIWKEG